MPKQINEVDEIAEAGKRALQDEEVMRRRLPPTPTNTEKAASLRSYDPMAGSAERLSATSGPAQPAGDRMRNAAYRSPNAQLADETLFRKGVATPPQSPAGTMLRNQGDRFAGVGERFAATQGPHAPSLADEALQFREVQQPRATIEVANRPALPAPAATTPAPAATTPAPTTNVAAGKATALSEKATAPATQAPSGPAATPRTTIAAAAEQHTVPKNPTPSKPMANPVVNPNVASTRTAAGKATGVLSKEAEQYLKGRGAPAATPATPAAGQAATAAPKAAAGAPAAATAPAGKAAGLVSSLRQALGLGALTEGGMAATKFATNVTASNPDAFTDNGLVGNALNADGAFAANIMAAARDNPVDTSPSPLKDGIARLFGDNPITDLIKHVSGGNDRVGAPQPSAAPIRAVPGAGDGLRDDGAEQAPLTDLPRLQQQALAEPSAAPAAGSIANSARAALLRGLDDEAAADATGVIGRGMADMSKPETAYYVTADNRVIRAGAGLSAEDQAAITRFDDREKRRAAIDTDYPEQTQLAAAAPAGPAGGAAGPAAFAQQYGGAAKRVADQLGIDPNMVLAQWGLETGWGKSVIPGTNNLGNIKAFNGKGVAATDNMTGSRDAYRQYASADAFADDYAALLTRRYGGVRGAGSDVNRFAAGLKGYAEDPQYGQKLAAAYKLLQGQPAAAPAAATTARAPAATAAAAPQLGEFNVEVIRPGNQKTVAFAPGAEMDAAAFAAYRDAFARQPELISRMTMTSAGPTIDGAAVPANVVAQGTQATNAYLANLLQGQQVATNPTSGKLMEEAAKAAGVVAAEKVRGESAKNRYIEIKGAQGVDPKTFAPYKEPDQLYDTQTQQFVTPGGGAPKAKPLPQGMSVEAFRANGIKLAKQDAKRLDEINRVLVAYGQPALTPNELKQ